MAKDLLKTKPARLAQDGNFWRIIVRDECLDWLAHFREREEETFDSIISRLIDHELERRDAASVAKGRTEP
jgi:hypothetical protein